MLEYASLRLSVTTAFFFFRRRHEPAYPGEPSLPVRGLLACVAAGEVSSDDTFRLSSPTKLLDTPACSAIFLSLHTTHSASLSSVSTARKLGDTNTPSQALLKYASAAACSQGGGVLQGG